MKTKNCANWLNLIVAETSRTGVTALLSINISYSINFYTLLLVAFLILHSKV